MTAPFTAGRDAAMTGQPSSANPYDKPERPAAGEAYPGDWANWQAGWCWGAERKGRCTVNERGELHKFTMKGIGYVGK